MGSRCGIIAILGRPNVGKSTLLNTLIGQKIAAVASKPQTTRQQIRGIRQEEVAQLIFLDTPGYQQTHKALNQYMLQQTEEACDNADVAILLLDATQPLGSIDVKLFQRIRKRRIPHLLVLNKIDCVSKANLLPMIAAISKACDNQAVLPLSALQEDSMTPLITELCQLVPEGPPLFPEDQPTDQSMRVLAAEIIREKLFEATHEEIPYSLAVEIEQYEEPETPSGTTRIGAIIHVEKKSQKPIVIGKQGHLLKEVGQQARRDIEALCGTKVFLSLHVKIAKDWTKNPSKRKEFGYA